MAQDPQTQLYKSMMNAQMANIAGNSSYSGKAMHGRKGFLPILGAIAAGIAAGNHGDGTFGLIPALGGVIQGVQRGKYLDNAEERAISEMEYQRWKDAQEAADFQAQNTAGGLPGTSGFGGVMPAHITGAIGNTNFTNFARENAADGTFDPQGPIPAEQLQQMLFQRNTQRAAVNNMLAAQQMMPQALRGGQQGSAGFIPNQAISNPQQPMPSLATPGGPVWDDEGLKAGVQKGFVPEPPKPSAPYLPAGVDPFSYASDVPTNTSGIFREGVTDNRQREQNVESVRKTNLQAKLEERKLAREERELKVKEDAGYFQPGGAFQNPYAIPKMAQEIAVQELETLTQQAEKTYGKDDNGAIRWPKNSGKKGYMEAMKMRARIQDLQNNIGGGAPGAFEQAGSAGGRKLDKAGQALLEATRPKAR